MNTKYDKDKKPDQIFRKYFPKKNNADLRHPLVAMVFSDKYLRADAI